jgi:putative transposase
LNIDKRELFAVGKERTRVRARRLFCFLAARELGMSQVEVSKLLKLSPAALTFAVKRGELLAREKDITSS